MERINFVTNIPGGLTTGGFSSMSSGALDVLQTAFKVSFVGPIDPPFPRVQKIYSKLRRTIGMRGDFAFFSEKRLSKIAEEYVGHRSNSAKFDFFHGFTPWIKTRPAVPYVAWSDCTFHDYIRIYHDTDTFSKQDLARIEAAEAEWLKSAKRIGFSSRWAAERAIRAYGLNESAVDVVGAYAALDLPIRDEYSGDETFVFISTDFSAKGGEAVCKAFALLRHEHPQARLEIIGDPPPSNLVGEAVDYRGFLRKENPTEFSIWRKSIARARAIVNSSTSDILPILFIEAGYFGCPVISTKCSAIPEIIKDTKNGLLVRDAGNVAGLANAMSWMLESGNAYFAMRKVAREIACQHFSRQSFEEKLIRLCDGID